MGAIQVRNIPPELHEQLRQRARREHQSLSEYIQRVLERELALPSTGEWLEKLRADQPVTNVSSEEIGDLIHQGRAERDEQILHDIARD